MGYFVTMITGVLLSNCFCPRIRMLGWELTGDTGKTMMHSGDTFGTFIATKVGIQSNPGNGCPPHVYIPSSYSPGNIIKQNL
jgi:hypothetical protein